MYICMYMFKQLHSTSSKRGTASTDRTTFAAAAMRWLRQLQERQAVLQLQHQTHDLLPGSALRWGLCARRDESTLQIRPD